MRSTWQARAVAAAVLVLMAALVALSAALPAAAAPG